mgnify:CR=1 FL=1
MQSLADKYRDKNVVWLAINSTTPEHVDHMKPVALASWMQGQQAAATHTLMDESGRIGRAYGARTTPHMYVIDPQGKLVYAGAIDSKPSASMIPRANAGPAAASTAGLKRTIAYTPTLSRTPDMSALTGAGASL